jgi:hypothetical protein
VTPRGEELGRARGFWEFGGSARDSDSRWSTAAWFYSRCSLPNPSVLSWPPFRSIRSASSGAVSAKPKSVNEDSMNLRGAMIRLGWNPAIDGPYRIVLKREDIQVPFEATAEQGDRTSIIVSDVACSKCGGPVTMFTVPDKVWRGLGFAKEWVCLFCVARLLNPEILNPTAEGLSKEIYRQRAKFELEKINDYCGEPGLGAGLMVLVPGEGVPSRLTAAQAMNQQRPTAR